MTPSHFVKYSDYRTFGAGFEEYVIKYIAT